MSLKQLIKKKKLEALAAVDAPLVLPGEPMIYSIKYNIGSRTRSIQFFPDMKWKSLLKSFFRSYYKTSVPVVVVVTFFVSPPEHVNIKQADLKKETVPAVHFYEVCDYLLSFLEMLHHVLINSYRQVVKVEVQKFYSAEPRTVFQFMKWEHYVNVKDNNTIHTESKASVRGKGNFFYNPSTKGMLRTREYVRKHVEQHYPSQTVLTGSTTCDSPLQIPAPLSLSGKKRALQNCLPHIKKPDGDNLEKFLNDSLNGIIWNDDSRIAWLVRSKSCTDAKEGETMIFVRELQEKCRIIT
jgi:Holliday junction resolvase RusA-like endonuclease